MGENRLTARAFFAKELRRAREAKGLSQETVANALYVSASLVAKWENGSRTPQPGVVNRLMEVLDASEVLVRLLDELVSLELVEDWFREWVSYEQSATSLRTYEPLLVPGLLQTPDYMRAVLRSGTSLTGEEIEQQVTARLARQEILSREQPPQLIAIVDEGVLRRPVGGDVVMHEQLAHLAEIADHPRVRVQVIPLSTGMYEGLRGPFVLADFDGTSDAVYLDTAYRGVVVERAHEVAAVKRIWESLSSEALPRQQSLDLMVEAAQTWT